MDVRVTEQKSGKNFSTVDAIAKTITSLNSYALVNLVIKLYNICNLTNGYYALKKQYFFIFCSLIVKIFFYDDFRIFMKYFSRLSFNMLYPSLMFNRFISSFVFAGMKERSFCVWNILSFYALKNFRISHLVYSSHLLIQLYYPFGLVPSRHGRRIFKIAQNIRLRRTFTLLSHRLKKNVKNLREFSLLRKWYIYVLHFLQAYYDRYTFLYFTGYTMRVTKQNFSRRHFRVSLTGEDF